MAAALHELDGDVAHPPADAPRPVEPTTDAGERGAGPDRLTTPPGLVCAHHHLYSALARGLPGPPSPPTTFLGILEPIWWRLDVALDLDAIAASARLGALEALEAGCTALIDHHESPNAIDGSLDVIADACAEVGVRVSCAYGVTDRHGVDGAKAGLAENERFLRASIRPTAPTGPGRRPRRLHLLRRHAGRGGRAGRRPGRRASTSTWPRDPTTPTPPPG